MATYNRPGVYLEEVASSVPVSSTPTSTVATFMGYFAKGPLDATLVSSWSQFTSLYGDISANSADADAATAVYLFFANGGSQCYVQRVMVTVTAVSNTATSASTTLTIVSASSLATSDGGSTGTITAANAIGATITGNGISAGTIITNVASTTLTLSKTATVPSGTSLTITSATASKVDIKGNTTAVVGAQTPSVSGTSVTLVTGASTAISSATVSYTSPNTTITAAGTTFVAGNTYTITGCAPAGYNGTWTAQTGSGSGSLIINVGTTSLGNFTTQGTITTNTAHSIKPGQTVTIAGTASSGSTPSTIYNGNFVVTATPTASSFTVVNTQSPSSAITTAGTVTGQSATTELTLTAKSPGVWGNSLYYDISSSTASSGYPGKYFNLAIYSGGTSAGYIVERFSDITMLASDPAYAVTVINSSSNYVVATDPNAANHTTANFLTTMTPLSTALVGQTATSTGALGSSTLVNLSSVSSAINAGMYVAGSGVTSGTTVTSYGATPSIINIQTPTYAAPNITLSTASAHNIAVGATVVVSGVTPTGYNGTWTAQSGTTGTTLVINVGSNPGAITAIGTVTSNTAVLSAAMTIPASTNLVFSNTPLISGADGLFATNTSTANNTAIAAATSLAKLDAISQPILLNACGVTAATDVNAMLTYAYNRGDVFVLIDPTQASLDVSGQLALANAYTGGTAGSGALAFGAVYYPNLTIPSPTSSVPGATVTAYPGGAVAAKYATTDASRGVFKSPAGLDARLSGVLSVASLTNTELDYLNNGTTSLNTFSTSTPVNAIRYIPGSGIVVMGARTLSSTYNNRYISVRRSLIYLRKTLTDATAFALFESNDERLWNRLQTTCEAILINFWQSGGLKGSTSSDAFYVKADSSINTSASVAAGEVHLEIGVALQRPAEFVVIRISQYDSGSVVTVL